MAADPYAATHARAAARLINTLGVEPVTYFKAGAVGRQLLAQARWVQPTETDIINAYGLGARIVTVAAETIAPDRPAQFDRVEIAGALFTVDYVHELRRGPHLVAFKLYCMGQAP